MSNAPDSVPTSAAIHGPRWGARAADWAELAAGVSTPAWQVVAEATRIGPGTRVLDIGCGSGEFCQLAAGRGAAVSGIDAAEGMIDVARRLVPNGDLRVGAIEELPWHDDTFDVVTAFNALQFAADPVVALAEARRVARPGGHVAVCNWGRPEDCELVAVMAALRELQPPPPPGTPPPGPPALVEPGALEELARRAGLAPVAAGAVDVPFVAPDQETLERALLAPGGVVPAIDHSGEQVVRMKIVEAAAPFRRPDGSYRLNNRFRYVILELPASAATSRSVASPGRAGISAGELTSPDRAVRRPRGSFVRWCGVRETSAAAPGWFAAAPPAAPRRARAVFGRFRRRCGAGLLVVVG